MPPYRPAPAGPPLQITEKLLITAGGWEAIRHARALRETGRVSGATWSPPVLRGFVREGEREYHAGLKIKSPTNVENLCSCRPSREWGTVCAHSLAVGLAIVAGREPAPVPVPVPGAGGAGAIRPGAAPGARPGVRAPIAVPYRPDPAAEARLHIVLAPDLSAAWAKGQMLVGLELVARSGRTMLGASGNPDMLLPDDLHVIERFAQIAGSSPGGMMFLDRPQFLEFLEALTAFPRVTLGRGERLTVDFSTSIRPPLRASFNPDGSLELAVLWPEGSRPFTAGGRAWLLRKGAAETTLQPIAHGLSAAYQTLFEEKSRRLPADQAASFLSLEWPKLEPFFDLRADPVPSTPPAGPTSDGVVPQPGLAGIEAGHPLVALAIEGSLHQLGARITATYPNRRVVVVGVTPDREAFTYVAPDAPPGIRHTRNVPAERAALGRLTAWGFAGPDTAGHYFLRGEEPILRFFALGLPALRKEPGWQVTIGARFTNVSKQIEIITPEVSLLRSGEDWFEMEVALTGSSGERFSGAEIQRLLQMGTGSARLRNGKLAILPAETLNDLQEVLRDCDPSQPRPGVYRLAQSQGAYLEGTFERWNVAAAPSWEHYLSRKEGIRQTGEVALPRSLSETMRPYQQEGVRWLHLLAANGLGGILADEMGLGKTLQALAYLASCAQTANQPSLVVCPTSLVDNWQREAAKFTPDLKTLAIDGPDRAPLFAKIDAADLVITSYALLRRDLDRYRARQFAAVILDEAHQIKNPDSQVAQAACALRSDHRFVLTGTPMENSVRDLWSIMHFALPGYLGSRQDFRERYEQPLSRGDADPALRERLTRRLRPVLLRRRKKDVATELPDRIEQTAFCDLTPAQSAVYRQLLEQSRLKLDTARRDKNKGAGRMLVLTALLRLRQACCDLRLLGLPEAPHEASASDCRAGVPPAGSRDTSGSLHISPSESSVPSKSPEGRGRSTAPAAATLAQQSEDAPPPTSSAKLALLDELLEEIREGGHRVLIFSQFVSMLKILSAHLEGQGMGFCYLDGSTRPRERTAQVERFQNDDKITAFLISVKAGGVGLNLTGADTVIHFDPWWNPAVEAQATDRAHRIGQTRVVTAYRLIARNTVEEKIFALQNRKKELTASLVEREKDEPLLETLSFEEIESLLE